MPKMADRHELIIIIINIIIINCEYTMMSIIAVDVKISRSVWLLIITKNMIIFFLVIIIIREKEIDNNHYHYCYF